VDDSQGSTMTSRRGTWPEAMTRAAIYARKSNDQHVTDEEKSVTWQIEHAREYALRQGWTVSDAHVYVDDGISGAEFARRPGFVRLMAAFKPRPPFDVLILYDESRLGREQIEVGYALKQIAQAGVKVWLAKDGRQRTLDTPTDKIMLSLVNFAAEMHRVTAAERTPGVRVGARLCAGASDRLAGAVAGCA
jgi:DNA invertase Pin-like site-specific DNA recombinase